MHIIQWKYLEIKCLLYDEKIKRYEIPIIHWKDLAVRNAG